ncbi:2-hydroxyacid dehydrogenase [Wenxinia saemankumensis]|uniref:Lactate dehydrogenase n=1 Tax=Wenxinia saemankumensis TaxID=1447782 RepID=A0A1M6BYG8_9RHOB|nr:D-glycerate dehydrogenase [Wenxinia saemankumensis]SHI53498.1 Lactate dehydrogenase [Wenxinia saemankumensis]
MRVLITRQFDAQVMARAAEAFETVALEGGALDEAAIADALVTYDAIMGTVGDAFTAGAFAGAGDDLRCGMIANVAVGHNHIDLDAARAAGVLVSNTPDVLTDATADIGWTLLLSAARRAGEGERLVRSGRWGGFAQDMLGLQVTGKTLGIVGMGRIGQAVAKRGRLGFDMEVLFHNRSRKEVPGARQVESLEALMAAADFVVVTVPGGAGTRGLIGPEAIAPMKPTGILVNIARGEVVDETALIEALEEGRIAGAGLDVYENEPDVPERLRALENAVLLPHLGSATIETRRAMGMMALDNLIAYAEGRPPPQALA